MGHVASWLARRRGWLRDLWDGTSWKPGRDWLTRDAVPDIGGFWRPLPGDRREPR